ncbi:CDP-diglyceride synthetase [Methanolobus profundi]|uniref:CDP-archaeol synthase n=1 Tax=Methanolobus profundi TaxID=487685 RepID=A0A1I4U466_9EURY|nr:CDP-diglyceride synthetase [Methanolobus profundi]
MILTIEILITAVWLMLPAYLPNSMAAVFGGGPSIDGGRTMSDGRRMLGDGKTWRGLFAGTLCGMLLGLSQMYYLTKSSSIFGVELPSFGDGMGAMLVIFTLAFGSLLGDMSMSFFKRRMGYKRGAALPGVDQLDFVMGAWLLTLVTSPAWFLGNFTLPIVLTLLIVTPLLHFVTNVVGYFIGVKNEPW